MENLIFADWIQSYSKYSYIKDKLEKLYTIGNEKHDVNFSKTVGFIPRDCEIASKVDEMKHTLKDICTNLSYFRHTLNEKIMLIIDPIIYAINRGDILLLARCTRLFMEHVSCFAFLITNSNKTFESINKKTSEENIEKEIKKFINNYIKLYYSSYYFNLEFLEKGTKKVNINDLIRCLDKEMKGIKREYDFLCDFSHPYLGGNVIIASDTTFRTKTPLAIEERESYINRLLKILVNILEYYEIADGVLKNEIQLFYGYYEASELSADNIVSIFKIKKTKKSGDGKSPETAIVFLAPKTALQYAQVVFEFYKNNKIDTSNSEFKTINGIRYHVTRKDGKPFWVQFK
ncbi:hypothetical protein KQ3_04913 [Bacillus cereus B5-2]|nr:hypothetical protein KQ3_04913 [Bacillus cereus B5-2]